MKIAIIGGSGFENPDILVNNSETTLILLMENRHQFLKPGKFRVLM